MRVRFGDERLERMRRMRAVVRDAAQHNGDFTRLIWQRRKVRPRPLVIIADISGSMEKYTRLLLQFLYSVARSLPQVECFVFGTRLTRITRLFVFTRAPTRTSRLLRRSVSPVNWLGPMIAISCSPSVVRS